MLTVISENVTKVTFDVSRPQMKDKQIEPEVIVIASDDPTLPRRMRQ